MNIMGDHEWECDCDPEWDDHCFCHDEDMDMDFDMEEYCQEGSDNLMCRMNEVCPVEESDGTCFLGADLINELELAICPGQEACFERMINDANWQCSSEEPDC